MLNGASKNILGQVMSERAVSRFSRGFIVPAKNLPDGKGVVPDTKHLALNREILVKVVGQLQ